MKPPYIKLFIKDFAFDIQDLSNEELGKYVRDFLKCYKKENIPAKKMEESLFKELKKSFDNYSAICERNRKNRSKSKSTADQSSTSGRPVVNDSVNILTKNQEHTNHKHIKEDKEIYKESFDLYNKTAKKIGIPVATKLTQTRESRLRARLKDCGGIDGWKEALKKIEAIPAMRGVDGWRANIDFLLRESSFVKLMEGGYDNWGKNGKQTSKQQTNIERNANALQELVDERRAEEDRERAFAFD